MTSGDILYNGQDRSLRWTRRSGPSAGLFLAFQYPMEIPGVATMQFLKVAMNEQRKARREAELSTPDFIKKAACGCRHARHYKMEMLKRPLNVGFSGGEKKARGDFADGAA